MQDALRMALLHRRPDAGLLHHSDRGVQYAAEDFQELLTANKMICSMSRKGNCWDNAVVESFFGSLKNEWIQKKIYETLEDAKKIFSITLRCFTIVNAGMHHWAM